MSDQDSASVKLLAVVCHPRINNYKKVNLKMDVDIWVESEGDVFMVHDNHYQNGAIEIGFSVHEFYNSWESFKNSRLERYWLAKAGNEKGAGWINQKEFIREAIEFGVRQAQRVVAWGQKVVVDTSGCLVRSVGHLHVCPFSGQVHNPPEREWRETAYEKARWEMGKLIQKQMIDRGWYQAMVHPAITALAILPFKYRRCHARALEGKIPTWKNWMSVAWNCFNESAALCKYIDDKVDEPDVANVGRLMMWHRVQGSDKTAQAKSIQRACAAGKVSTKSAREWFKKFNVVATVAAWAGKQQTQKAIA